MVGLRWLGHSDILDITSPENYEFIYFVFWWHWSVSVSVLCPVGFHCYKENKSEEFGWCSKRERAKTRVAHISLIRLRTYLWPKRLWTGLCRRRTEFLRSGSVPWISDWFCCRCTGFLLRCSCLQREVLRLRSDRSRNQTSGSPAVRPISRQLQRFIGARVTLQCAAAAHLCVTVGGGGRTQTAEGSVESVDWGILDNAHKPSQSLLQTIKLSYWQNSQQVI